jgi:hypothetical protein
LSQEGSSVRTIIEVISLMQKDGMEGFPERSESSKETIFLGCAPPIIITFEAEKI